MTVMLRTSGLAKSFTLHLRGGLQMPVLSGVDLEVRAGECVVLSGPSGAGKTTLLRSLYGNYRADGGAILVRHRGAMIDIATAEPRSILAVRHETLGYVSQFLRVVPRVAALDVVAEVLLARGVDAGGGGRAGADAAAAISPSPPACTPSRRPPSPAASSSGSTWRAASSPRSRYCCWTNPRLLWMRITGRS